MLTDLCETNPYNCTKPGNLFVGRKGLLDDIMDGLRNGHSYAVIAGRRLGKTSFLLKLKHELKSKGMAPYQVLPLYVDFQELNDLSTRHILRKIHNLIAGTLKCETWESPQNGFEYEYFLQRIATLSSSLEAHLGNYWLVVLIIDEIDRVDKVEKDDQFYHNLRNLLTVSDLSNRFRVVAGGASGLDALTISGSPLNNLRYKYLNILDYASCELLIKKGFTRSWVNQNYIDISLLSGRHPYILQGLLEKLWPLRNESICRHDIISAGNDFLREHRDFESICNSFKKGEHAVYRCLMNNEASLSISQLRKHLGDAFSHMVNDAVTVLSYNGVLDDSDTKELKLTSLLFENWYRENSDHDFVFHDNHNINYIAKLEMIMRDKYESHGQAGYMGPDGKIENQTFEQKWEQSSTDIDVKVLALELGKLKAEMEKQAVSHEEFTELATINYAEKEAKTGDKGKILQALTKSGKWSLSVAEKIGVNVAAAAIKQGMGL